MEKGSCTFIINLSYEHKRKKLSRIWLYGAFVVLGLLCATLFVLIELIGDSYLIFASVLVGYGFVYVYFTRITYRTDLYIKSDDLALRYKFDMLTRASSSIVWKSVVNVKFGPTYIAFFRRAGKRKVIRIGWLPYTKVIEIKAEVARVCGVQGIPYVVAQIRR